MISELNESSMVVRITLGAANPEIAFQLKSQVQEHILDYLNNLETARLSVQLPIQNLQWSWQKHKLLQRRGPEKTASAPSAWGDYFRTRSASKVSIAGTATSFYIAFTGSSPGRLVGPGWTTL
jgi:hypothetical protein